MTAIGQRAHAALHSRLQEEADAHGIDHSMLNAMTEEYRRIHGSEPETLTQLICGVTC